MQLDWTVADALLNNRGHSVALLTAGHLLFDIMNDTETNFTYFGIVEDASFLLIADAATLSKYLTPLWIGHVVSVILHTTLFSCFGFSA